MTKSAACAKKRKKAQERDRRTLEAIGEIYCSTHHREMSSKNPNTSSDNAPAKRTQKELCAQCAKTVEYALTRTGFCPNNHEGNCADCEIHCFNPTMRKQVQEMMSFAAPRMLFRHPIMTIRYLGKKTKAPKSKQR